MLVVILRPPKAIRGTQAEFPIGRRRLVARISRAMTTDWGLTSP